METVYLSLSMRKMHLVLLSWFLPLYHLDLGQGKIPIILCFGDIYCNTQILTPESAPVSLVQK